LAARHVLYSKFVLHKSDYSALHCGGSSMAASVKQLTLVMLHCGQRILLGMKKRGFGEGKINVRSPFIRRFMNSMTFVDAS
jgi:hypothetical protein